MISTSTLNITSTSDNDDISNKGDLSFEKSTERLTKLSSHIKPKQKLNPKGAHLPADYSDVLSQINTLRDTASTPNPDLRGYIRQKQAGKLWVRERIEQLLDPGTFEEIGSISGTVKWRKTGPMRETPESFVPSNNVQGKGKLRGRKVLLTVNDFSIRGGHADGSTAEKTIYMEKLAVALKLPVVKLVDGSSGGGSVTTIRKAGWSYLPHLPMYQHVVKQLNMGIPNLGAVVGPAIGLGAARVVSCHFSVMAADIGSLFNAGPKVVEGATFEEGLDSQDLGGPMVHCTNGTIDNLAANEAECYEQLRTVLSYLPNTGTEAPPIIPCEDPENREDLGMRQIIPRRAARMYNPRTIITTVVDCGSWFEIGPLWGRTAIGGLARLGGRPVGGFGELRGEWWCIGCSGELEIDPIAEIVRRDESAGFAIHRCSWLRHRHHRRTISHNALGRRTRQNLLHNHHPNLQCNYPPRLRRRRRDHDRFPRSRDASCLAVWPMGLPPLRRRDRSRPSARAARGGEGGKEGGAVP